MLKSLLVAAVVATGCGKKTDAPSAGSAGPVVVAKIVDATNVDTPPAADAAKPVPMSGDDMIGMLNTDHVLDPLGTLQVPYWKPGNLQLVFLYNIADSTSDDVKLLATQIVTKEVELLIKSGYNPRLEHANVSMDVLLLGKSVTGAQTHQNLGHALYFWSDDKVTWEAVTTTTK